MARPPAVRYGIFIFRPMHVDELSSLAPTLFICNIAGGKICVNLADWSAQSSNTPWTITWSNPDQCVERRSFLMFRPS